MKSLPKKQVMHAHDTTPVWQPGVNETTTFMSAVINALSGHIAVLDRAGTIQLVNTAWCDFATANRYADPQVGLGVNYLALCEATTGEGGDEALAMAQGIRSIMEGKEAQFVLTYPCHSPIEQRWFMARLTRFSHNGASWVVAAHENITELWQMSEALRRLNQELQDVTYSISHDLRSPLRGIDYLAQWILEDSEPVLSKGSCRDLYTIRQRVARMQSMLDGMLAYARAGQEQAPIEAVNPVELVQDILALFTVPPAFTIDIAANLPMFYTHKAPLAFVLRNVFDNAIKHHHRPDGHITISAQSLNLGVEFCIADDGPGISDHSHSDMFMPFRTLHPVNTTDTQGMGLALVKKTVDRYGGDIRVESVLGQGTRFFVTWPVESGGESSHMGHVEEVEPHGMR